MMRWKLEWTFVVITIFWTFLGVEDSSGDLLQNMEFETDIAGWTTGAVDPLGTWDVQWSEDYGGSARMYVSGAPAQTNISQETQIAIMPGDQLTVNVFHSDMGNFSNWALIVEPGDSQVLIYGAAGSEGIDSLTWTADQYYDPGALITVSCSVWPGESTTWVDSLTYTPVPEPCTLSLLALGGIALLRRRKH